MKLPNWLGWILWKLKFAIRCIDDIKVGNDIILKRDGGFTIDYEPTKWHYVLNNEVQNTK